MRNVKTLRNRIGTGILTLALLASFWTVASRNIQELASDQIEIRIGHSELHTGMREAFEAAIKAYQALHPGVRIVQTPIPQRIYPAWSRTQLVGGTAPDIMPLAGTEIEITQFFLPLTDLVTAPNPYNAGTSLEGVAWRDTFFDGLTGISDRMRWTAPDEVFGVMLQTTSLRLYINRDMLREITGSDALPREYADLYALGQKIRNYNQRTGKRLIPIASCKPYAEYTFDRIVASQTQKFLTEYSFHMMPWGLYRPMYDGVFTYSETPEFVSSLELMHEVSQLLSPGFQQFAPEDAIATYLQQRSVMLVAGSWDYAVLIDRVPFETVVSTLPMPSTNDPRYGRFTLGQAAEPVKTTAALGVIRTSPHPEVAIDFLRFLTSQPIATEFANISKRLSAIIDVPVPEGLQLMAAQTEGEIPGFRVDNFLGSHNIVNLIQRHIHKVIGPQPDLRGFAETIDAELPRQIREDLRTYQRFDRQNTQRLDALLALHYLLPYEHPAHANWIVHAEAQSGSQHRYMEYQLYLEDAQP
ncbi:hypothetical protein AXK11_04095 [Cephaloticoccus primus]|uniref:ABC transporter substrate-binding protein n=1 Tax=Cephaloticoccus primus TaxID=1548207 RepID=A0A139SQ02_9BACT|nr:ABC transporter substrate-binding protein [Cephaloticoccus primus]KXU36541.1 hypothetical protein AXK11_04095 [Cephaloticoccus primus]